MINDNQYEVKSGISKNELELLNDYLMYLENNSVHDIHNRQLSKIIDEVPAILYAPKVVILQDTFLLDDIAFVYDNSKIVGHYCHKVTREKTEIGHNTIIELVEKYTLEEIPEDIRKKYIMERISGKLQTKVMKNEKSYKK